MDNKLLAQLESLHLSPNEARVYLALLETGQTSAGELIKKTGLHRGVVYGAMDKLIARELAFKLHKEKIAYFQPIDPSKLLEQIKNQEILAGMLVPKLKKLADNKWPEINVHEGAEAYRRFWIQTVQNVPIGTVDYVAGSIGPLFYQHMGELLSVYMEIAIQRKIKWQTVSFSKENAHLELLKDYPKMLHDIKIIDRKIPTEGNFNIIEDTLVLHSATEPTVVEIKNKALVKVFKNIFDILWEQGKPIKR